MPNKFEVMQLVIRSSVSQVAMICKLILVSNKFYLEKKPDYTIFIQVKHENIP